MRIPVLLLGALAAVLVGCDAQPSQPESSRVDPWLITYVNDAAVRNAIIRQQTMFPYHFVAGGAALNDLGRQDLEILLGHYRQNPGTLSIRQGEATKELYDARVAAVMDFLRDAGLPAGRLKVTDTPAGGEGMPSGRVLTIIRPAAQTASPPLPTLGSSMSGGEKP